MHNDFMSPSRYIPSLGIQSDKVALFLQMCATAVIIILVVIGIHGRRGRVRGRTELCIGGNRGGAAVEDESDQGTERWDAG